MDKNFPYLAKTTNTDPRNSTNPKDVKKTVQRKV